MCPSLNEFAESENVNDFMIYTFYNTTGTGQLVLDNLVNCFRQEMQFKAYFSCFLVVLIISDKEIAIEPYIDSVFLLKCIICVMYQVKRFVIQFTALAEREFILYVRLKYIFVQMNQKLI